MDEYSDFINWLAGGGKREKHLQGKHDQKRHGARPFGNSRDYEVEDKKLAGGRIQARIYRNKKVPGSELQVVTRSDGRRSVATFLIPEANRGKGLGKQMLLRALRDGPISIESFGGVSDAYRGVQNSLVRSGLVELYTDEYGVTLMRLKR